MTSWAVQAVNRPNPSDLSGGDPLRSCLLISIVVILANLTCLHEDLMVCSWYSPNTRVERHMSRVGSSIVLVVVWRVQHDYRWRSQ